MTEDEFYAGFKTGKSDTAAIRNEVYSRAYRACSDEYARDALRNLVMTLSNKQLRQLDAIIKSMEMVE